MGIIKQVLKRLAFQKQIRFCIYPKHTVEYGNKNWTLKDHDKLRITAAKMKIFQEIHKTHDM